MSAVRRLAVAGVVALALALAPAGVASADNSNSNTNTNDVTSYGGDDFSAGEASANENAKWPPTDLGWPPHEIMSGGESDTGGNENAGNKGGNESEPKPIVMPQGQSAPGPTETPSTSEPPKPIVGVASP